MIDLSISIPELIIVSVVLLYIMILSISITKYQSCFSDLKLNVTKLKFNHISELQAKEFVNQVQHRIVLVKNWSTLGVIALGLIHLIIVLVWSYSIWQAIIPLCLFIFVLLGNFWLKGGTIIGFMKNTPNTGQWDIH
jgi:hypothetical protein